LSRLETLLQRQGFVILDGGLASELERHGANLDDPLWSGKALLETPELVERVSYEYFEAGADVAVSASYQLTIPGLVEKGCTRAEAEGVLRQSVAVVRRAAARSGRAGLLVAASIGPYGAYLHDGSEYRGDYALTRREFQDFHRERLAILIACEPDVVAFETLPNALEAVALAELLTEFPGVTAWLSFSCRDGAHIWDGTALREAVAAVAGVPQIAAIGVNCTAPRFVSELLEEAAGVTTKPLVAYPNSGECYLPETGTWGHSSELESISSAAADWYRRGARLIGGCCRTTPDTTRAIRSAVARAAVC
jgi:homocysteine S-methyltransferase